jgi:hypothetical protein
MLTVEQTLVVSMPPDRLRAVQVEVQVARIWPLCSADPAPSHDYAEQVVHPWWKSFGSDMETSILVRALAPWCHHPRCQPWHGSMPAAWLSPIRSVEGGLEEGCGTRSVKCTWQVGGKAASINIVHPIRPTSTRVSDPAEMQWRHTCVLGWGVPRWEAESPSKLLRTMSPSGHQLREDAREVPLPRS